MTTTYTAPSADIATRLVADAVANGGAALDIETGSPVTTGYAVGCPKLHDPVVLVREAYATDTDMAVAVADAVDSMRRRGIGTVGSWLENGSKLWIDAVTVYPNRSAAHAAALADGELAYYHLDTGTEYDVATSALA